MFGKFFRILLPLSATVPETDNSPTTTDVDIPKTSNPGSNELDATTTTTPLTSKTPILSDMDTAGICFTTHTFYTHYFIS